MNPKTVLRKWLSIKAEAFAEVTGVFGIAPSSIKEIKHDQRQKRNPEQSIGESESRDNHMREPSMLTRSRARGINAARASFTVTCASCERSAASGLEIKSARSSAA